MTDLPYSISDFFSMIQTEEGSTQLMSLFQKNQPIQHHLLQFLESFDCDLWFGKYQIRQYIGKGYFSTVFKAKNTENDRIVAIKFVDLNGIDQSFQREQVSLKARSELSDEEVSMRKCKSAYIIKLFDSFTSPKCKVFVMEYCNNYSLKRQLMEKGKFIEKKAVLILRQIVFGLAELHRNEVIHRDINPTNILINNGLCKLSNIGFPKDLPLELNAKSSIKGIFKRAVAPQVIKQQAYGTQADIWSLGITFFLMIFYEKELTLAQNYQKAEKFVELKNKDQLFLFDSQFISCEAIDFLVKTLEMDPAKRMSLQQILDHNLMTKKEQILPELFNLLEQQCKNQIEDVKQIRAGTKLDVLRKMKIGEGHILGQQYFQCRKSQFLITKLIIPILENQILDFKNHYHIQFLYLVISRCQNNLTYAISQVKMHYDKEMFELFSFQLQILQQKIHAKFMYLSELLSESRKSIPSKLKGILKSFIYKNEVQEAQKFLSGKEGVDFSKEQQIKFVSSKYIPIVQRDIRKEEAVKYEIFDIMVHYEMINFVREERVKGKPFYEGIKQLLQQ